MGVPPESTAYGTLCRETGHLLKFARFTTHLPCEVVLDRQGRRNNSAFGHISPTTPWAGHTCHILQSTRDSKWAALCVPFISCANPSAVGKICRVTKNAPSGFSLPQARATPYTRTQELL